jgi:hypothetical protein
MVEINSKDRDIAGREWWFNRRMLEATKETQTPEDLESGQPQSRIRRLIRERFLDPLISSGIVEPDD